MAGARPYAAQTEYSCGQLGVAICTVTLSDVRKVTEADAGTACMALPMPRRFEFAWLLASPEPLPAVRVIGKLGLYRPGDTLLQELGLS